MGTSRKAAGHSLSATILRSAATVALSVFLATGAQAGERHERAFVTEQDLGFLPVGKSAVRDGDFDLAARNAVRDLVRATVEDFSVRSVHHDRLGGTHTRMRQTIHGLPVLGAELIVSTDRTGAIVRVNGEFARGDKLPTTPGLSGSAAMGKALGQINPRGRRDLAKPDLVYVLHNGETHLAWSTVIEYRDKQGPHRDRVFADAADGTFLGAWPQIHYAKVLRTYDANNGTSLPGTLRCSSTTCNTGDVAIDDAHNNAGTTYDYYNAKFGRDSLNDSGLTLTSTAHYSNNYNNAFWNGSQMVYGDGDGSTFIELSRSLDVVAHELTHGVTDYESDLIYANESGALNEALSDIFGAAVEAWVDGGVSANTWLLGEDIYTPGTGGDALRYMDDPTEDGYSADYYPERLYPGNCTPSQSNDNCGVHGNSGIANLAFVLMVEGGTHPRGKTSIDVTPVGLAKAEQIFYRAQTTCLTASSNFQAVRDCTAEAASDLYGSTDESRVHEAWDAVGVPGGSGGGGGELQNGVPVTGLSGSSGSQTQFTIDVPSGASNLSISISGGSGDADLYVRFGSPPTTSSYDCRPYLNGNNESCDFASPSAGTYHVMLRGYTSYSGVTLEASFDEPSGGGNELDNGVPVTGLSGSSGSQVFYTIAVPSGASNLSISISGGSGDADLYVRFGSPPTTSSYDCRPYLNGNNESCDFASPSAGTYHVMLRGYTSYSGATLVASYDEPGSSCGSSGAANNLSASTGQELRYTWDVPACAETLTIAISGGSGDADLYVRFGSQPTTSSWDCRPYQWGNNESCSFNPPQAGPYHIMLRAYSSFSGVDLTAQHD